jgi:hypothetical protein
VLAARRGRDDPADGDGKPKEAPPGRPAALSGRAGCLGERDVAPATANSIAIADWKELNRARPRSMSIARLGVRTLT